MPVVLMLLLSGVVLLLAMSTTVPVSPVAITLPKSVMLAPEVAAVAMMAVAMPSRAEVYREVPRQGWRCAQ